MKLKQRNDISQKQSLSSTLKSWLPILQANSENLEEEIRKFQNDCAVLEVNSKVEAQPSIGFSKVEKTPTFKGTETVSKNSQSDSIEALTIAKKELYEVLEEQITNMDNIFPTQFSQDIALEIIENIGNTGFFEGDEILIAQKMGCDVGQVQRTRERFCYLEPFGVGCKSIKECFSFQLFNTPCSDKIYELCVKVIDNIENCHFFKNEEGFKEAMKLIKGFKTSPALEFFDHSQEKIPDIIVEFDAAGILNACINEEYQPFVSISSVPKEQLKNKYIKNEIKKARGLIDALQLRKDTLQKVAQEIIIRQEDFFLEGGSMKPMILKDIADELGRNTSTISRAISNKYVQCDRGIFALKDFFTTAINEDVSNAQIKDYLKNLVKNEPKAKPYSDNKLLAMIQDKFEVNMVRRTISKYRQQLHIASSGDRKKFYSLDT